MVYDFEQELNLVFHALSDRTRRNILERLAERSLGIAELAKTYDMSLVAVSKHIQVLEKAGLVTTKKDSRVTTCVMRFEPLEPASQQIELYKQYWRESAMDLVIERIRQSSQKKPRTRGVKRKLR
jgi:DNA-binding transcriptional ArsR family regulator